VLSDYKSILKNLRDYLQKHALLFSRAGFRDGVYGTPDIKIEDRAEIDARTFQNVALSELKAIVQSMRDQETDLMAISKATQQKLEKELYYNDILTINKYHIPNLFSWLLCAIYVLVGSVLLVSDFFLSTSLVEKIFDLHPQTQYWIIAMTSVGIACLSTYVKIFYDEYVGISDGLGLNRFNKLMERFEFPNSKILKAELLIKFLIKGLIFCSVFLLFYQFAQARYGVFEEIRLSDPDVKQISTSAMLIPIVAGILFSLSFKIYHNIRALKTSDILSQKLRTISAKEFDSLDECRKYRSIAEGIYDDWVKPHQFYNDCKTYFLSFYSRGYSNGKMKPNYYEKNTDIISQMEKLRLDNGARKKYFSTSQMN
jgi:hypothetical protein